MNNYLIHIVLHTIRAHLASLNRSAVRDLHACLDEERRSKIILRASFFVILFFVI